MQTFSRLTTIVGAVMLSSTAVLAQSAPPAPTTNTPSRTVTPNAPAAKPPVNTRARTGPGTQTEDDHFVGSKRTVQGVNTPTTSGKPPVRSGAGVSPNTGGGTALTGGDDDLNDLEVERRTVQGVERPSGGKPVPKPGAGTSPNTGRTAGTTPSPVPAGTPPRKP
jgi:hypothetical protein